MGHNSSTSGGASDTDDNKEQSDSVEDIHYSDEEWENVSTPEEIAEMIGWEADVTRNKSGNIVAVKFHDPISNMEVEFNSLNSNNAKHLFDMENLGREAPDDDLTTLLKSVDLELERRNFRDVVRIIQEMDMDQKMATPLLYFDNNILSAKAYGYHSCLSSNQYGHMVTICGMAFLKNSKETGHSLERTIDHEMNHAVDYMSSHYKNSSNLVGSGLSSKQNFVKEIERIGSGKKAITENVSVYSKKKDKELFDMRFRTESYADTKSIVNMKKRGRGNEYIKQGDGTTITVNEFCDKYPDLVKIVENLSVSPKDYGANKDYNFPLLEGFRH